MPLLHPGQPFPELTVALADGASLHLPADLHGDFAVVLFYRGSWCPYCNAQLRAFQRSQPALTDLGVRTVAVSVDDEPTTAAMIAKHGLTYPVGHSADASAVSAATGAFVDPDRGFLQSTGFILAPDGTITVSVYSSGAIGRLVPGDVVGMIRYIREHAAAGADA